MKSFSDRTVKILQSNKFYVFVIIFFIIEAVWIAISAVYPQAFDENYHFGLIQIYSHHLSPFLSSQPPNAGAYGAVAREPSYLYHYLMSFPYRIIAHLVSQQTGQVISLRIINVALFTGGIILSRKVLLRVGFSKALANLSILLVALIPIAPLLAAQINYDNLVILMVSWIALITFDVIDQIKKNKISIARVLVLISLCILTSLVKYAFLPIFLGIIIFLLIYAYRCYKGSYKKLLKSLVASWKRMSLVVKLLVFGLFILSSALFIQRDGVNLVKYHAVDPDCSQVISMSECSQYSVWEYDHTSHIWIEQQIAKGNFHYISRLDYAFQWCYWMWYRLFFTVNGPASSFTNYPPLPLPAATALAVMGVGILVTILYFKKIFYKNPYLVLLLVVTIFYTVTLFLQGYASYHSTNVLQNMNGRYLLPIIFFIVAIIGTAFSVALKKWPFPRALIAIAVLLLFLQGGGVLSYISRSDDTWYVENSTIKKVNDKARKITDPVIVNGNKTYTTSLWFFN